MENPPWSYTDQKENVYAFMYLFMYSPLMTTSLSEHFPGYENRKDKSSLLWFICGKCNVTRLVYFTISVFLTVQSNISFQLDLSLKSCDRPECHFNDNVILQCNFLTSPKKVCCFVTDYQKNCMWSAYLAYGNIAYSHIQASSTDGLQILHLSFKGTNMYTSFLSKINSDVTWIISKWVMKSYVEQFVYQRFKLLSHVWEATVSPLWVK